MGKITLSLFVLSFSNSSLANGVEFEIPMFSKEVVEQGIKTQNIAEDKCEISTNERGDKQRLNCGSSKGNLPDYKDLGDDSSDYAQDQVQKHSRKQ